MMTSLVFLLTSAMGFNTNVFFTGADLKAPFDLSSIYKVDTTNMQASVIWHGDSYLMLLQPAPKTGRLAFIGARDTGIGVTAKQVLYIISKDGSLLREIADASTYFSWSTDGRGLAYCAADALTERPNGDMWILDVASGSKKRLPGSGYALYWTQSDNVILISSNNIISELDVATHESHPTPLPITMRGLSPTEQFCMNDCGAYFEVSRLAGFHKEPQKIATIRGQINDIPTWLNGHLLRTIRTHRDGVYNPFWYLLDCEKLRLVESKDNVIAADDEDSLLVVKDGKILKKKVTDLMNVPLGTLGIEVNPVW